MSAGVGWLKISKKGLRVFWCQIYFKTGWVGKKRRKGKSKWNIGTTVIWSQFWCNGWMSCGSEMCIQRKFSNSLSRTPKLGQLCLFKKYRFLYKIKNIQQKKRRQIWQIKPLKVDQYFQQQKNKDTWGCWYCYVDQDMIIVVHLLVC